MIAPHLRPGLTRGLAALGRGLQSLTLAWIVVVVALTAALGAGYYGVVHLGVDSDTAEMFDERLPFRQRREAFNAAFPQLEDTIVAVVEADIPEDAEGGLELLIDALEARPDIIRAVYAPGHGPFWQRHGLLYRDSLALETLVDQLAQAQFLLGPLAATPNLPTLFEQLQLAITAEDSGENQDLAVVWSALATTLEDVLAGRPAAVSWRQLLSTEGQDQGPARRLAVITPVLDFDALQAARPAMLLLREVGAAAEAQRPGVRIALTGNMALAFEELEAARTGAIRAGLLSLLLVALALVVGLGSGRLALVTLVTLVAGLLYTAALAAVLVGRLNMISIAFAVLYIGIGVDYAIHLGLRYQERRASTPNTPPHTLLAAALAAAGPTLALCALSTAVGFYAFLPAAFVGVRELGLIGGSGLLIGFVTTMVLLPALIRLLPPGELKDSPWQRLAVPWLALPESRPVTLRWVGALAVVVGLVGSLQVGFNYDPLSLRDPSSESMVTLERLMAEEVFTPWGVDALVADEAAAQGLAERWAALDKVTRTITLADFVPAHQEAKRAVLADARLVLGLALTPGPPPAPTPSAEVRRALSPLMEALAAGPAAADPTGAAERLLAALAALERALAQAPREAHLATAVERALLVHLPPALESLAAGLNPGAVTVAELPDELRQRWVGVQGQHRVQAIPVDHLQDQDELRAFAEAVTRIAPDATGDLLVYIGAGDVVAGAFFNALVLATTAVGVLLVVGLGRVKDAAGVILALALALALTATALWLGGGAFNYANVIALPLLLGLGVDNGIHVLHRLRRGETLPLSRSSTARAVWFSALTTLASFATLMTSAHRGMASMGLVLTLGVIFTLFATLWVLPAYFPSPPPDK